MVFIGAAEPDIIASGIRVPETYPEDIDRLPFDPRDVVRIRNTAQFDDFYEIYGEPLGEGKFGKVYQCREKSSGLELAAKFIKIRKDADRATVEREVSIMTKMRHPRIAQIYDAFCTTTNDVILVMEIVRGGELFNRVAEDSYILTEKAVAMIVCQICEAIDYIHGQNIIHLDIKPENIMCVSESGNRVKLIDFGLAQYYDGSKDLYYMAGTPEFAAPEVIKYEPLDYRTDMWSVGVITYILLSGYSPFLGDNVAETYVNVERGEWEFTEEFDIVSESAKTFIRNLLSYEKSNRMYPKECLQHPWIVEARAAASIETLPQPSVDDAEIKTANLKRYIIRRRFRKLAFAVMCYVDFRRILFDLRKRHSATGEAYFAEAKVPAQPSIEIAEGDVMGSLLSKPNAEIPKIESENEQATADATVRTSSAESPVSSEQEKPKKKKKKNLTTTSSGTERPREKKIKKTETVDNATENHVPLPLLKDSDDTKEKVQKKRTKQEATSMATTSQEKPPKIVKKSSTGEMMITRRHKSPTPTMDVPAIVEEVVPQEGKESEQAKLDTSETSGIKKKRADPSPDAGQKKISRLRPRDPAKKGSKSLSATKISEESNTESSLDSPEDKKTRRVKSSASSSLAARVAQFSRAERDVTPLKPPEITVHPPTPASAQTTPRPTTEPSRLKSPQKTIAAQPAAAPSSELIAPARKQSISAEGAKKKRVWRQEKHNADEVCESRRSTEVIAVPKDQLPPEVEAEKAALVRRRAQASPLAERIARMENMANEKEREKEERRHTKIHRNSSSMKSTDSSISSTVLTKVPEQSGTLPSTTSTTAKMAKEAKLAEVVAKSSVRSYQKSRSSERTADTKAQMQVNVKEDPSEAEDISKPAIKKTVVKKSSKIGGDQKTENNVSIPSEKKSEAIIEALPEEKAEPILPKKKKAITDRGRDVERSLSAGLKKKVSLKEDLTNSEPKKPALRSESESRTSAVTQKPKIVTATLIRTEPKNNSGSSTLTKPRQSSMERSSPIIAYPPSIADDIQVLKEVRAKAKRKEEESQFRHVRFADESQIETEKISESKKNATTSRMERTASEESRRDELAKARRKNSYFEVTEDEEDTLANKEDFSFASLRERLQRQLSKKGLSEEEEPSAIEPPKKDFIHCPSTNSLLKKWKNIEKTTA